MSNCRSNERAPEVRPDCRSYGRDRAHRAEIRPLLRSPQISPALRDALRWSTRFASMRARSTPEKFARASLPATLRPLDSALLRSSSRSNRSARGALLQIFLQDRGFHLKISRRKLEPSSVNQSLRPEPSRRLPPPIARPTVQLSRLHRLSSVETTRAGLGSLPAKFGHRRRA